MGTIRAQALNADMVHPLNRTQALIQAPGKHLTLALHRALALAQGMLVTQALHKVQIQARGMPRIQILGMWRKDSLVQIPAQAVNRSQSDAALSKIHGRSPKLCCTGCTAPKLFGR